MTFQRFLAEWADHNAQLVDNRATLAIEVLDNASLMDFNESVTYEKTETT